VNRDYGCCQEIKIKEDRIEKVAEFKEGGDSLRGEDRNLL